MYLTVVLILTQTASTSLQQAVLNVINLEAGKGGSSSSMGQPLGGRSPGGRYLSSIFRLVLALILTPALALILATILALAHTSYYPTQYTSYYPSD